MLVEAFTGYTKAVKIAYDYVTTAVFINSFLNPLVYCWRMREIRRAVMNLILGREVRRKPEMRTHHSADMKRGREANRHDQSLFKKVGIGFLLWSIYFSLYTAHIQGLPNEAMRQFGSKGQQ